MRIPLLLLSLLAGCSVPDRDGGVDCTTEARASVIVRVVDDAGAAVADASVRWSVPDEDDGGACEASPDGESWTCGWERSGELTVTAEAPGRSPVEATVEVGADACHVQTEAVTLVLPAPDCTDEEVPAVELHVTASTGGPIAEALAYYVPSDEDWSTPGECALGLDGLFWCAWERSGDLDVWVHAKGWSTWSETITVGHDGCHPITERRSVVLEPR